MRIPLSSRLEAACRFVRPGDRVADIGCDHGYLGIYLLKNQIASHVYACDINEGPLNAAVINSEKFGVRDRMQFFLSDGVKNTPRDFDVMVCAGMGGDTMISILSAAPWLKSNQYRLILQCQSKTPMLRQYVSEKGWKINAETVVRDGRFLYTVMELLWQPENSKLTAGECYFSPALLQDSSPDKKAYFDWVVGGLKVATQHTQDPQKLQVLEELEKLSV